MMALCRGRNARRGPARPAHSSIERSIDGACSAWRGGGGCRALCVLLAAAGARRERRQAPPPFSPHADGTIIAPCRCSAADATVLRARGLEDVAARPFAGRATGSMHERLSAVSAVGTAESIPAFVVMARCTGLSGTSRQSTKMKPDSTMHRMGHFWEQRQSHSKWA